METFRAEKVHYFRARVESTHPKAFDDVIRYFQRECALSRGSAIIAARKTCPQLYNEFHARAHHQTPSSTPARESGSGKPVQTMAMHADTARIIRFRGL
jgi:hypothetical protein